MKILKFDDYKKSQEERLKLFARLSDGTVLDIGYAQNPNIYFDEEPNVKQVVGIDIQINNSLPKKYISTNKLDLNYEKIPYPDNYFDTIVCGEVIEHLECPTKLIREINRVLKNGGKLILSTPSSIYYLEILSDIIGLELEKEHLYVFNRRKLVKMLNENGFQNLKTLSYNFWIPLIKLGIISFKLPEIFSWIQIYICEKSNKCECEKGINTGEHEKGINTGEYEN